MYIWWAVNVTHLSLPLSPSVLIPDISDFVCVCRGVSRPVVQSGDLFAVVSQKVTPSPPCVVEHLLSLSPSLSPPPSLVPDRLVCGFHSEFTVVSHNSHPTLYPHYMYIWWAVNVTHLSLPLSPSVLSPDTSDFVCRGVSPPVVQSGDLFAVVSQKVTPSSLSSLYVHIVGSECHSSLSPSQPLCPHS